MISGKMMTKISSRNFEKRFPEWETENMTSKKIFWDFLQANFLMFILLISNHTVQFRINLHLRLFQKAKNAPLAEAARAISLFWKKLTRAN